MYTSSHHHMGYSILIKATACPSASKVGRIRGLPGERKRTWKTQRRNTWDDDERLCQRSNPFNSLRCDDKWRSQKTCFITSKAIVDTFGCMADLRLKLPPQRSNGERWGHLVDITWHKIVSFQEFTLYVHKWLPDTDLVSPVILFRLIQMGENLLRSILSRSFNCDHDGYLDNVYMSIQDLTTPTKECARPRARFWVSPHQLRPTDGWNRWCVFCLIPPPFV